MTVKALNLHLNDWETTSLANPLMRQIWISRLVYSFSKSICYIFRQHLYISTLILKTIFLYISTILVFSCFYLFLLINYSFNVSLKWINGVGLIKISGLLLWEFFLIDWIKMFLSSVPLIMSYSQLYIL